jgi:DNA-binding transcriptional regulator YhcF (GntR family)
MAMKPSLIRFEVDRDSARSFFEQVRDQLINLVHFGAMAPGYRLPTVRQLARDGGINLKTAFKIYRALARAGLVEIRPQSGIFVRSGRGKMEQAYRQSVRQFVERVKAEAALLNLTPQRLAHLLAKDGLVPERVTCAVLECNREQTRLFCAELERQLGVRAIPVELFAPIPPRGAVATLRRADFLLTTDFHWEEGHKTAQRYRKKILRLRLDPSFMRMIVSAARRGPFTMIITDTSIQQRMRQAMAQYLKPVELDRIRVVHDSDQAGIAEAVARGGRVYVSPLCAEKVQPLLGPKVRTVRHQNLISEDCLRELRESLMFYPLESKK